MTVRMPPFEIGTRFGDWVVISQFEQTLEVPQGGQRLVAWSRVRCVCGTERDLENNYLRAGQSRGCGCARGFGLSHTTHGKSKTPNYKLWKSVKQRLQYDRRYENVHLHESWQHDFAAFDAFIESLGPKPTPLHTLDRIEGTKGYEPGNLRWADKALQSQNRKNVIGRNLETNSKVSVGQKFGRLTVLELVVKQANGRDWYGAKVECECGTVKDIHQSQLLSGRTKSCGCLKNENVDAAHASLEKMITANGMTMSMANWARRTGLSSQVISYRINRSGWTAERAVMEPLRRGDTIVIGDEEKTVYEWCQLNDIPYDAAHARIRRGWDPVESVTKPIYDGSWITIGGERKTLADWCRAYGVQYPTVYKRIEAGMTPEEALTISKPSLTVTINGVTKTLKQWCKENGTNYATAHARLKNGMTPEEAVMPAAATDKSLIATIGGETKTLREWCEIRGLTFATVYRRVVQLKMDPAEALALPVREFKDHTQVEIDGVTKSLTDWCKERGVVYTTVCRRIRGGMSPVDALKPGEEAATATIDGVTKTLSEWCDERGLTYSTVLRRMRVNGMTAEEAVSTEKLNPVTMVTMNGEMKPLREWCKELGILHETVRSRMFNGMDPVEALTMPVKSRSKKSVN